MTGSVATPFSHSVRVYWEDTDAGGVVFYANYLKFFERARTEWLRALGVQQQALREATGAIFIVSDTALRYLAPARLDDLLAVTVVPVETGRASLVLQQQAWRLDAGGTAAHIGDDTTAPTATQPAPNRTLLCEGRIRIGCVDANSFRPRRFPAPLADRLGHTPPTAFTP